MGEVLCGVIEEVYVVVTGNAGVHGVRRSCGGYFVGVWKSQRGPAGCVPSREPHV